VFAAPAPGTARPLHLAHAMLLAAAAALFIGGLLSDLAYVRTYQVQWVNFAAWLIAGAMVFTGLALAWSLLEMLRARVRQVRTLFVALLLLAVFVLGLLDSFMHARDAWGSMPSGLLMTLATTALCLAAIWVGISARRPAGAA